MADFSGGRARDKANADGYHRDIAGGIKRGNGSTYMMGGIPHTVPEGYVESICLSGKYGDIDLPGGRILFSGNGGHENESRDMVGRIQISDQEWTPENKALLNNYMDKVPFRVLKIVPSTYDYNKAGLYYATGVTSPVVNGFTKIMFEIEPAAVFEASRIRITAAGRS